LTTLPWSQRLQRAQHALDQKTKPPGSLGQLETIAAQLSAIQNTLDTRAEAARAIVLAADHGVTSEGVSAFPQAVTRQMLQNFSAGGAAINALCRSADIDLQVVDCGIAGEPVDGTIDCRIAAGTANFVNEAAMTVQQYEQAISNGRALTLKAARDNIQLLALGEMGIGNTTSAAAIVASLCNADADTVTGRGTGVDDHGLANKVAVVEKALHQHAAALPDHALQCLGGFEIATMAGAMLEAARHPIAIVVDGYIATAAALCAVHQQAECRHHMIFAHQSAEPGHAIALARLEATPLLQLNMRLGEGSGAALAIPLIRAASAILTDMATFADAGVSGKLE
jgi:nicotinate-nucleotide--dimethylbenzimidazole phosphoribosyltransferase